MPRIQIEDRSADVNIIIFYDASDGADQDHIDESTCYLQNILDDIIYQLCFGQLPIENVQNNKTLKEFRERRRKLRANANV